MQVKKQDFILNEIAGVCPCRYRHARHRKARQAAYTPSGYAPRVSMPVRSPRPAGTYQPSSQVSAADTAAIEQKLDSLQQLLKNRMDYDYTVSKERTADRAAQDVQNSYELNGADEGRRVVQERENTNYRFLQLIYKKMLENDVNENVQTALSVILKIL